MPARVECTYHDEPLGFGLGAVRPGAGLEERRPGHRRRQGGVRHRELRHCRRLLLRVVVMVVVMAALIMVMMMVIMAAVRHCRRQCRVDCRRLVRGKTRRDENA